MVVLLRVLFLLVCYVFGIMYLFFFFQAETGYRVAHKGLDFRLVPSRSIAASGTNFFASVKGRSILNASAGARRFGPPKVTNTAPWRLLLTICAVSMWPSPSKSTLAETLKRGFVRNASFDVAWRIASDVTGRHASFDGSTFTLP